MEEVKAVKGLNDYIVTDILKGVPDIAEVRRFSGKAGRATMFEVLDTKNCVTYIIKQHQNQKNCGGLDLKDDTMKEWELSKLLCDRTNYVGKILDVQSVEDVHEDQWTSHCLIKLLRNNIYLIIILLINFIY